MTVDAALASRCTSCGTTTHPEHSICGSCGGDRFESIPIEGEGTVLTYTDLYALAIDFEQRYLRLAMVEMDSGLRATGQLLIDDPKLGARVRATVGVVRKIGERKIYGLQFVSA
jgi:uncharacterized OB-fold protein